MTGAAASAAFAFPGVGVFPCGAEVALLDRERAVLRPFLEEASEWAGAALEREIAGGDLSSLSSRALQLCTYAFSCGAAEVYRRAGARPAWVAGYSLGIYAALWAAECVSYGQGLALVARAYDLMSEAVTEKGPFAMGVVVGLPRRETEGLLRSHPSLRVANVNSDVSLVFGGLESEVGAALARAEETGASRARLLPADAPIHHPMLSGVSSAFRSYLEDVPLRAAACPVVCSIDQRLLQDPASLRDFTAANLSTPIHWQRVVETLKDLGASAVFECGHGVSLTQNARFLPGAPRHFNVRNWQRAFTP